MDTGQAGTISYEVDVTPEMLSRANFALREWLGDGRSERATLDESVNLAVAAVLIAALGKRVNLKRFGKLADVVSELYGIT